jgi:gluconolactonase
VRTGVPSWDLPGSDLFPRPVPAIRSAASELRVLAGGIDHPECVAWHDDRVWCGTESGDLLAIDPLSGAIEVAANVGGFICGIAFDHAGRCWICDVGNGRLLRLDRERRVELVVEAVDGRRLVSPNFPAVTRDGTVWFADSGSRWGADDGILCRVRPDDSVEVVARDCGRFPNGIALSADEDVLYLVESRLPGVVAYDLGAEGVGPRRRLLRMPGTVPDGLALDSAGSLYIACWRPDRVYRLGPDGSLAVYLDDPTAEYMNSPTNLCFGGHDGRRIYLAGLCGWAITEIDAETPGLLLSGSR